MFVISGIRDTSGCKLIHIAPHMTPGICNDIHDTGGVQWVKVISGHMPGYTTHNGRSTMCKDITVDTHDSRYT